MIKLSIIIPLYNSEKYISGCLDSLIDQDLPKNDYEIIIIDDGSTDESLSVVKKYAHRYSNLKLYSQKNQGASVARNYGIKIARGEFLYFVDSDDYIAKNVLKKLVNFLEDDLNLLVFETVQTKKIDMYKSNTENIKIDMLTSGLDYISKYGYYPAVGWFIIKKKYLLKNNIFYPEGRFLEDIFFNLRLFTNVKEVCFVTMDVYRYVQRPNSTMTKKIICIREN